MNNEQIKHMVDRFLGWQLPRDFNPDGGVSYTRTQHQEFSGMMPSGTNILDASQAEVMVRYMVEGMTG